MNSKNNRRQGFQKKKFFHKNKYQNSNNTNRPRREFCHVDQLTENEVGISEFTDSTKEGFTGVIKARYSDFHVNEIDSNGQLCVLTNTNVPKEERVDIDFNTIDQSPIEILPQNKWDEIKDMMKGDLDKSVEFEVNELSKDDRKNIHLTLKNIFGDKMNANTLVEKEKKTLVFKKSRPGDRLCKKWPEDRPHYVHFIVYKEAVDTMNACYQIAEACNLKPSMFSYAGVKDKRGKTSQWFCVKQVDPWKLIFKTKKLRFITVGNITFKDSPLKLGDLSANRFKVVLKNVVADDLVIQNAVEHVQQNGFVNYYGLQRFGNDKEVPTFTIGLNLLLGKWKEACDLILKQKKSDDPNLDISKAKKAYAETGDAKKALGCLEKNSNSCVEAKLLEGLSKEHKNEYVNSLESIPRNMRLFYIHSFQSLIWNRMVSRRIEKYGLKPVENDLVVVNNVFAEPDMTQLDDDENELEKSESGETSKIEKPTPQVKRLSASDLSEYTIFDIVLPLPGYDVVYPEHMRAEYQGELEKHGLTLEMPKQRVRTYTLSGAYRRMVGRVQDLKWKIMRYNDPNSTLILSDFDILRKFEEPVDIPDGKYRAVILELTLESSMYATMVLREIMKIDTSPSAQIKLNDYDNVSNKSKKIASTNGHAEEKFETIDANTAGSLLNDQQKLEAFKKSIFSECSTKRQNEDEENDASKKLKTDDN